MDIMGMMKKASAVQAKMAEIQAELDNVLVDGVSGGGMVAVVLTAKGELKSLTIDPSLLKADEKEILEDLIVAAHAEARRKAETLLEDKMKAVTAGLGLPAGMKLPF
jgi:DNA-binding YbaB/EbfC family protein